MSFNNAQHKLPLAALEAVRDAVLITDAKLEFPGPTIVYANAAFCEMTGYTVEDLLGQTPRLLQGPDTDPELMQRLKQDLLCGKWFFGETINYRKDSTPFRMEWSVRPCPDDAETQYYIAIQRDVTAQRDLEQQRLQMQTLIEIQRQVGTAGLDLQTLREQVAQIAMTATGAEGAAIEEAVSDEMLYTAACGTAASSVGLRLPIAGSLSGTSYRERQSIYCRDTQKDPRVASEAAARVGFRSGVLVLLTHKDRCFGVLKVYANRTDAFGPNDLELLNMASQVLAASLADAQRFKGERDRRSLLVDSLPIMISFIDSELHYREINAAYVQWFNRPIEEIVGKPVLEILGEAVFEKTRPYMQAALEGQQVEYETLIPHNDGTQHPVQVSYTPLLGSLGESKGFYAMVRDITDQERAERDYLTEAFNRRGFETRLEAACATSKRYQRPLSLIFLDLDYFKAINDSYGHAIGDEVLRGIAQTLLAEIRETDILSRWGGEEFGILAPETPPAEAAALAERLREAISSRSFPTVGRVTASLGVAQFDKEELPSEFLRRADEALYAAKANGRDRVAQARS